MEEKYIEELTQLMHKSEDPFWSRIRELLKEKGLELNKSILVDCFPDDEDFEFGIVLTKEQTVFQFGFNYSNRPVDKGKFSEWKNITKTWQASPYRKQIEISLQMVES